ncbi:MAG TPA: DUF4440 domain-containing protein [Chitinophagaceae bacterium]
MKRSAFFDFDRKISLAINNWMPFMLFILGGQAIAQKPVDKDVFKLIIGYEQALMDGVAIGDKALWNKRLHDSCVIVMEDGRTLTKAKMIKDLNPLPKGYVGRIVVIEPKFQRYGNTVVITFVNDEYLDLYQQHIHTQYRQSDTWQLIDGQWKIISMQIFEIPKNPSPIVIDPAILARYTGVYQLSPERTAQVFVEGGKLMVKKGERLTELHAQTENVFFRAGDGRVDVLFLEDTDGKYRMIERREGEDLVWKKV